MKIRFLLAGLLMAATVVTSCVPTDDEKPQPEQPAPVLTAVSPAKTAAGALVTLKGEHLGGTAADNQVVLVTTSGTVAELPVPQDSIKSGAANEVKLRLPGSLAVGVYGVKLTTRGKTATLNNAFEVFTRPVVTAVGQAQVVPGQSFVITGVNFGATAADNLVTLGSTALTVTAASTTQLNVTVPLTLALGTYQVAVTVNSVTSTGNPSIAVVRSPIINSITPTRGPAGTKVAVRGAGFNAPEVQLGTTVVALDGTPTDSTLTFVVPNGLTVDADYAVKVKSNNVTVSAPTDFHLTQNISLQRTEFDSYTPGQVLKVQGSGFSSVASQNILMINGTEYACQTATATELAMTLPTDLSAGNYTVTLEVNGVKASGTLSFNIVDKLDITGLSATSGTIGSSLTITGSGFNSPQVLFGSTPASITSSTKTSITCVVPSGLTAGTAYDVSVTSTRRTAVAAEQFTVSGNPTITSTEYPDYLRGQELVVNGTGFSTTASQNVLRVGSTEVPVTTASATQLKATLLESIPDGTHQVNVSVRGVAATGARNIVVVTPHQVTDNGPETGTTGSEVELRGVYFRNPTVMFGTVSATIVSSTATSIVCRVPSGLTMGTRYTISVSCTRHTENAPKAFTPIAAPVVNGTQYAEYVNGQTLVVNGAGFSSTLAANTLKLGSMPLTVTSATATQLMATIPSTLATGNYAITVVTNSVPSNTDKEVQIYPPATVTTLAPTTAQIGSTVTLTGTNFRSPSVKFGAVSATVTGSTATSITCTVPSGLTIGMAVDVMVTSTRAGAIAPERFTPLAPPTLSGTEYSLYVKGQTLTVSGTGFSSTASDNELTLGGKTLTVTTATATELTAAIPADAATGVQALSLKVKGVPANKTLNVDVRNVHTVTSISPAYTQENTPLTITGTGFYLPASVTIGGISATISEYNSTKLVCTVPEGLVIGNPENVAVTITRATAAAPEPLTRIIKPNVTSFSPGTATVGTEIVIQGESFYNPVVLFGTVQATVLSSTPTTIRCRVPSGLTAGSLYLVQVKSGGNSAWGGAYFVCN